MVFNSLTFLVFLAVVLAIDRALTSWRARKLHLLVASYAFYAAWNPPLVILIWVSTLVDWFAARGMARASTAAGRRAWLLASLISNFGLLGFFKYAGFLLEGFTSLLTAAGIHYQPPPLSIVLPVGISFYTFQTLSYTIDVYRGHERPWDSFVDFALFVTFFPQLVAGPIVRAREFHPQLEEPRRGGAAQFGWGCALIAFGLFEKVVLADGLFAPIADQVYAKALRAGFAEAWTGTLAFSGQIFCDFAGYSTCAIGVALCLGFNLPDNFRAPYAAVGFSDFWRRWHISLSGWLRDYLYIPLGGNRRGPGRTYVNLMFTMLLGGLWHGASWMFVIWGGLHGVYLAVERRLRAAFGEPAWTRVPLASVALALGTYALVCLTWVFFRSRDMASAAHLSRAMLAGAPDSGLLGPLDHALVLGLTAAMLAAHWRSRHSTLAAVWERAPRWARVLVLASFLVLLALGGGDDRAFIYFQF
jgi:alginate O-acetyltransferase complex protein AlgI